VESLDLAVGLRRAWFDVHVLHLRIFYMPVTLYLELVTPVCTDRMNTKRKTINDVIDEIDGVPLAVTYIDLQRPHPGSSTKRRVLETKYTLPVSIFQTEKFHIHLDRWSGTRRAYRRV
jgi:hypothetical protein